MSGYATNQELSVGSGVWRGNFRAFDPFWSRFKSTATAATGIATFVHFFNFLSP
jgi:hypothetical protein